MDAIMSCGGGWRFSLGFFSVMGVFGNGNGSSVVQKLHWRKNHVLN